MSEAARQAFTRIDKVLTENSGDLRTMVSNLTSFSEALGKNSGKVDSILGGLERMTGGGKAAGLVYYLIALPASTEGVKPLDKQLTVADPSALLTYDSGADSRSAGWERTCAARQCEMGRHAHEARSIEDHAKLREHRFAQ